jgi:lysophospholipase L1-like esterase
MHLRFATFMIAAALACVLSGHAIAATEELHVRSGLPHVSATRDELRVAYLGGSITAAANSWRTLTTEHLRHRFPNTPLIEIAAGLPGTGSDLGVCRLERDVLRHHPDLLFVEFAVNDTNTAPERIERTLEGIVRQTWRADPRTDIFFVYTVSTPGLPDLQAGNFPPAAEAMERVAAHYGIPSLHFGVEVARRVAAGSLVFKDANPDDARTFSLDGVHPTAAGHRVYFATLERALDVVFDASAPRPSELPAPLHADNWEHAQLREPDAAQLDGDWTLLESDDPNLRSISQALLPPTWRASSPGATLTFEFTGRTFGLLGVAAPDSGEFRVTVDEREPVIVTFFDAYVSPTFCRQRPWFYPEELDDTLHRVRIELLGTELDKAAIKAQRGASLEDPALYQPHRLTLSGVLTVDTAAR